MKHILAALLLLTLATPASGQDFDTGVLDVGKGKPDQSIRDHHNWLQSCSNLPVTYYMVDSGLVIFSTELGSDGRKVINCLLPIVGTDLSNKTAVIFPSRFDKRINAESGLESPMPEALVRTDRKVLIILSDSDGGVEKVQQVSGDKFIVGTSYFTHSRNFLVFGDSGIGHYLTDGKVEVVDEEKLIFRANFRKSYFDRGGAFWYDALIDNHGHILDIVTPEKGDGVRCMSRDELIEISSLNLSRVSDQKVCVWQ